MTPIKITHLHPAAGGASKTKIIYQYIAGRPPGQWHPKNSTSQRVTEINGARFKTVISFDVSYFHQSRATVERWDGRQFAPVLSLTAAEIPCVAAWYARGAAAIGEWLRAGDGFERAIADSLEALTLRAVEIAGE